MKATLVAWCLSLALLASATAARAEVYVVDRVVALVGDKPLLRSSLERRARPHLGTVNRTVTGTAERLIARAKIYRQVLDQLIDEQLMLQDAANRGVSLVDGDVERAVDAVAKQNQMTRAQLLAEVERSAGMTQGEYLELLGRQILEAKLIQLEAQTSALLVREDELRALHRRLMKEDPDGTPPFDEARSDLASRLQLERMQQLRQRWIARLREQAYVEVRWSP